MALGEYQIVGPIKTAVPDQQNQQTDQLCAKQAFDDALKTGKQVENRDGAQQGAVSISYAGVELASKKLHH